MPRPKSNGWATNLVNPVSFLGSKTSATKNFSTQKNLIHIRSFLGSAHFFLENSNPISHNYNIPLLKKNTNFESNDELESHFKHITDHVANTTEIPNHNPYLETRIKSDGFHEGLGAALEQRSPTGGHSVAFLSRFLKINEEKYSVNELKILGLV